MFELFLNPTRGGRGKLQLQIAPLGIGDMYYFDYNTSPQAIKIASRSIGREIDIVEISNGYIIKVIGRKAPPTNKSLTVDKESTDG